MNVPRPEYLRRQKETRERAERIREARQAIVKANQEVNREQNR